MAERIVRQVLMYHPKMKFYIGKTDILMVFLSNTNAPLTKFLAVPMIALYHNITTMD